MNRLDILRAARKYAEDPEHIVKDPGNIYEDEHGRWVPVRGLATRGCLLGVTGIACQGESGAFGDASNVADDCLFATAFDMYGGLRESMAAGHEAVLAVFDRAIADEEAKEISHGA